MATFVELDDAFVGLSGPLAVGDSLVGDIGSPADDIDEFTILAVGGETYEFNVEFDYTTGDIPFLDGGPNFFSFASASYMPEGIELLDDLIFAAEISPTSVTFSFTAPTDGLVYLSIGAASAIPPLDGVGYELTYTSGVSPIPVPEAGPTTGDDDLTGTDSSDSIDLLAGNDILEALGGSDIVRAGAGDDTVMGGNGNDNIQGQADEDELHGGNGNDTLDGGSENDILNGDNGNDTLLGARGNDILRGGNNDDILDGGEGNDDIDGGQHNDTMTGGDGIDTYRFNHGSGQDVITDFVVGEDLLDVSMFGVWDIAQLNIQDRDFGVRINLNGPDWVDLLGVNKADLSAASFIMADAPVQAGTGSADVLVGTELGDVFDGGDGADELFGNGGEDDLSGGSGKDKIDGGADNDTISGGSGDDRIDGGSGNDMITGDAGKDSIAGGIGNDVINGGNHNDRLWGDSGNDTIIGDNGNDKIWGGEGADEIFGGAGKDQIEGGTGNDLIHGGWGDDRMAGDAGSDTFFFDDRMRADTVLDFELGADTLDFSAWGFTDISDITLQQVGNDTFIQFSARDSLTLVDIQAGDLSNADFVWAPTIPEILV